MRDYTAPPPQLSELHTGDQNCHNHVDEKPGTAGYVDPGIFQPTREDNRGEEARAVCNGTDPRRPGICPILEECRSYGLHRASDGVWGGMSYRQIRKMRNELGIRSEAAPAAVKETTAEKAEKERVRWHDRQARKRTAETVVDIEETSGKTTENEGWVAA